MKSVRVLGLFVGLLALVGAGCASGGINVSEKDLSDMLDPESGMLTSLQRAGAPTLVNPVDLVESGQGKDGLPVLTDPTFVSVDEAMEEDFLLDPIPGIVLADGNTYRFYSYQVLAWHEVVNDTVAGHETVINYTPLTGHSSAFSRDLDGEVYTFGISGLIWNSGSLMYDTKTETLWSSLLGGQGIYGKKAGEQLERLDTRVMAWGAFRSAYPDGKVLSSNTGHARYYGVSPYGNYMVISDVYFPRVHPNIRAIATKAPVHGIVVNGQAKAYEEEEFARRDLLVLNETVGGTAVVVWVGADGVVRVHERIDGVAIIDSDGSTLTDSNDGSWTLQDDGSLQSQDGVTLTRVPSERMYWFAWASTHQGTELFGNIPGRGEVNGPINLEDGEGTPDEAGAHVLDVDPSFGGGIEVLDADGNPIEGGATITPLSN